MQSFCGRFRLVTRHAINRLKIDDSKTTRGFGFSSSEPNALALNGVIDTNFLGNSINYSAANLSQLVPKFASRSQLLHKKFGTQTNSLTASNINGIPSVTRVYRYSRLGLLRWAAVVPTFPCRFITTMGNLSESVSQDTSASVSEVAPRIKFKRLDKTAKNIMQILDKEAVEEVRAKREIPDIRPGYIIQLKVEVPENKRRTSTMKGIVIARRNAGLNTTIRLRRLVAGVGVESLLLLYSPNIKEIKVLDKKKVRRAKLYYLRDKLNPLKGK